ncbi:hypothetical protein CO230_04325 [Chryseobacterium sp. 6424]|nr:hypothetical protein CO230_04325 [Chryseobacterium sp. 6424]
MCHVLDDLRVQSSENLSTFPLIFIKKRVSGLGTDKRLQRKASASGGQGTGRNLQRKARYHKPR